MQSIFKHFWCHSCKFDVFQPPTQISCLNCSSELIEEVEDSADHPSAFVPAGISSQPPRIFSRTVFSVRPMHFFINIPREPSQGASDSQINSLETVESAGSECAICQDSIECTAKRMRCKHTFHEQCIVPWLKLKNSCPVCRTSV